MPEPTATRRAGPGRFADVRHFAQLDSTNRWLLEQAQSGAAEGLVAMADFQLAGRGRLGRAWVAPAGASLLISVLLRPPVAPGQSHVVTMLCGVAAADAVTEVAGFEPGLKWPNDLVAADRKLAGMLTEAVITGGRLAGLVVGLGLNVNWDDFPADIAAIATACNVVAGRRVDRDELAAAWLSLVDARYGELLASGDTGSIVAAYRSRCITLGRTVRIERPTGDLVGLAVAVDDAGRLVIEHDGARTAVAVGDVTHVRPA